jgi:hypothetical protein
LGGRNPGTGDQDKDSDQKRPNLLLCIHEVKRGGMQGLLKSAKRKTEVFSCLFAPAVLFWEFYLLFPGHIDEAGIIIFVLASVLIRLVSI